MMPLTVTDTTLCPCLHIQARHPEEGACAVGGCRCERFTPGSRTSAHHYQRGQRTVRKRVARLEPGDAVLVGFPGKLHFEQNERGGWESSFVQDHQLRAVDKKTGALVAMVTGRRIQESKQVSGFYQRRSPSQHVIETDLGDLEPMFGTNSVLVRA